MPQGPTLTIDGKKFTLHYFTGTMLATRKEKETVVSSRTVGTQNNPQVQISSTTVDHHEFFLQDASGKEESFKTVDLDFPCREGQLISVVWAMPEGGTLGPYIHVRNHNLNSYHQIARNDIADYFKKPWWMIWGSGIIIAIILMIPLSVLGLFGILIPFFYFRWRSRKAAGQLLNSPELMGLDRELTSVQPKAA